MWSSIESKDPDESGGFQELKEDLHVIQKKGREERMSPSNSQCSGPLSVGDHTFILRHFCGTFLLWDTSQHEMAIPQEAGESRQFMQKCVFARQV